MRHHRFIVAAMVSLLALALAPGLASARSVYLNGHKIDGLVNQTFKHVDVTIDSTGNVHIEGKQYSVKTLGGSSDTPTAGPPVTKTYWLVATETNPGKVQWDVEVFINGKFVKKVRWDRGQVVMDVTSFLVKGDNSVHFRARRNLTRPKMSSSPADKLQIVIGPGIKQGNAVVINDELVSFTRTAAQVDPVDLDMSFKAK